MDSYAGFGLVIAAGLAFIPANIAKKKGYNFGLWWLYGWLLWIVAIIHVSLIPDKNAQSVQTNAAAVSLSRTIANQSAADELKKYRELLDQGVISEEEFKVKKDQLLKLL